MTLLLQEVLPGPTPTPVLSALIALLPAIFEVNYVQGKGQ